MIFNWRKFTSLWQNWKMHRENFLSTEKYRIKKIQHAKRMYFNPTFNANKHNIGICSLNLFSLVIVFLRLLLLEWIPMLFPFVFYRIIVKVSWSYLIFCVFWIRSLLMVLLTRRIGVKTWKLWWKLIFDIKTLFGITCSYHLFPSVLFQLSSIDFLHLSQCKTLKDFLLSRGLSSPRY